MLPSSQLVFNDDLVHTAPSDMYAAMGLNEQRIYVVPSENMVVLRMGNATGGNFPDLAQFDVELWDKISNLVCEPSSVGFIDEAIEIYPNPSNGIVRINSPMAFERIEILDLMGKSQGSFIGKDLDLTPLANGTYLLVFYSANGSAIRRIVKHQN